MPEEEVEAAAQGYAGAGLQKIVRDSWDIAGMVPVQQCTSCVVQKKLPLSLVTTAPNAGKKASNCCSLARVFALSHVQRPLLLPQVDCGLDILVHCFKGNLWVFPHYFPAKPPDNFLFGDNYRIVTAGNSMPEVLECVKSD